MDFSDILPTLCETADTAVLEKINTDGSSILPLLKGKEHQSRPRIYCWYERNGIRNKASQHARTDRYKLYATGKFYDTFADPLEEHDLAADGIPEKLSEIHSELKTALDLRVAQTKKVDALRSANKKADKATKGKGKGKEG